MGLHPTRVIADSAFLGVALGAKAPGLVGAVGTSISALEQGDGTNHRTVLKVTSPISLITTPHSENLAGGALIYTFPAGQIIIHEVYVDMGLEIDDGSLVGDTPETALGTTLSAGANATIGDDDVAGENVWGAGSDHVAAGCDVGADTADAGQWVTRPGFIMASAGDHTLYFNCAATWSSGSNNKDLYLQTGRIIIDWTLIPVEGV